jgi:MinD superfamily P-loop ATPase
MGDNEIYDYLKQEHIPLLMEIPFDKTIARNYSKGEIVVKDKPEFQEQFLTMFNSILEQNANSSHQR